MIGEYSSVVQTGSDAETVYTTNDHLGSPRINTDATGQVISRHDYHPFGEEIARTGYGSDTIRKQFTGYERDGETDLDFAEARQYAYSHGRFMTVDPAMASADRSIPQSWNRYIYTINNPLKYIDPTGMIWGIVYNSEGTGTPTWYKNLDELRGAGATIFAPDNFQYRDVDGHLVQLDPASSDWAYVSDLEGSDLDYYQAVLSGVGMIPGLEMADTFNAGFSAGRGNLGEAGLDALGMAGPLTAITLANRLNKLKKLAKLGKLKNADEIVSAAKSYLKEKAGFSGNGMPVIVDNSVGFSGGSGALAKELRDSGINARSVDEMFGSDPGDKNIRTLAEQIGARVLTNDKGRDALQGGGFGGSAIRVRQGLNSSSYLRLLNEAIK